MPVSRSATEICKIKRRSLAHRQWEEREWENDRTSAPYICEESIKKSHGRLKSIKKFHGRLEVSQSILKSQSIMKYLKVS